MPDATARQTRLDEIASYSVKHEINAESTALCVVCAPAHSTLRGHCGWGLAALWLYACPHRRGMSMNPMRWVQVRRWWQLWVSRTCQPDSEKQPKEKG
jgi:DNA-binding transcriptional LysR family regulator